MQNQRHFGRFSRSYGKLQLMRFALLALLFAMFVPACSSKSDGKQKKPPPAQEQPSPAPSSAAPPAPTMDAGAAADPDQPDIVVPDVVIEK